MVLRAACPGPSSGRCTPTPRAELIVALSARSLYAAAASSGAARASGHTADATAQLKHGSAGASSARC